MEEELELRGSIMYLKGSDTPYTGNFSYSMRMGRSGLKETSKTASQMG